MKEDLNIDELFKQKFEGFEGQVDPSAWANISQSIGSGAAGGAGLSGLAKVAIVTGVVAVTSVSLWYFTKSDDRPEEVVNNQQEVLDNTADEISVPSKEIIVEDDSDPVIHEKEKEIMDERDHTVIKPEQFDEETVHLMFAIVNDDNDQESTTDNNGNTGDQQEESGNDQEGSTQDDQATNNENKVDDTEENTVLPVSCKLETAIDGNTLFYDAHAKNQVDVQWHFGDGNEAIGVTGEHTYERPGDYVVTMTVVGEEKTLVRESKVTIEGTSRIKPVSNIFTPNGDNKNDYFKIESEGLTTFSIIIFDINGKEVYSSNDPNFQWNGESYMGDINQGTYVYKIIAEGEDGALHKEAGTLQLQVK